MSHPTFNKELFSHLGGQNWVVRSGFMGESVLSSLQPEQLVESREVHDDVDATVDVSEAQGDDSIVGQPSLQKISRPQVENAIVVVGSGLDLVWENEEQLSWRLWQNIMLAFGWDESQIVFYDLDNLASDEMAYSTVEEIIELGVESVLSMSPDHLLSEQLADGLRIIDVPDLDTMLFDPHAKRSFYQAVVESL